MTDELSTRRLLAHPAQESPRRRRPIAGGATGLRWLTVVVLIVIWELAVDLFGKSSHFFASPTAILANGLSVFGDPQVQQALIVTAGRFGIAFVASAVVGVTVGLVIGRLRHVAPVARNVAVVIYAVPQVALYPLFVVWLGLGQNAEIAFGISHGLIPVLLGTMTASSRVDSELVQAARAMGASRFHVLLKVILPSCLPYIVGALRLGASLSLLGVLLAELLVSVDGIGGTLNQLAGTLQPAPLDALLVAVTIAAIVINVVITRVYVGLMQTRGESV